MLPIISLLVLVAVILVAWKFKLNPGLLGFGAAFALGFFVLGGKANVPLSSIKGGCAVLFSGFNYKLW
ncbi:MAG: hypothetical protein IJU32_05190, partial [Pyramidobacter sp.]|nr:hypothetical protein [Pyramidobacter sp.]